MKTLLIALLVALPLFAAGPKVEDVAWMQGHWTAKLDGLETEEIWLAPKASLMVGMNRGVKNGRATFEFIRIQQTKEGVFYFAQPGGKAPTAFKLIEATKTRAVFSNPEHDFPQRVIYMLRGGKLCGRIEGVMNGKKEGEEWCWTRRQ